MENKENPKKLKELETKMNEYNEMVAKLTEPFKTAMANKLAEQLVHEMTSGQQVQQAPAKAPNKSHIIKATAPQKEDKILAVEDKEMINLLDRTAYPELKQLSGTLDKALFILKIMAEKGYEWLNPAQVHQILYEVFKQSINRPAITMALFRDTSYSQKKGTGRDTSYRLSVQGEDYIQKKIAEINNHTGSTAEEPSQNLSGDDASDSSELAN